MLEKREFPILEFDENKTAIINPTQLIEGREVPEACVICFFADAVREKLEEGMLERLTALKTESGDIPIYIMDCGDYRVGLAPGMVGAAMSGGILEELIAVGFRKFIVCGGAGVLRKDLAVGHLVVVDSALRDEGTSYHYAPPSREIVCDPRAVQVIAEALEEEKVPYIVGKTWTTDALYRETRDKYALRVEEGCVTVEMEASAFFAIAQFRGVTLGQILYGGDDLTGEEWDSRGWADRKDVRKNLLDLSARIVKKL